MGVSTALPHDNMRTFGCGWLRAAVVGLVTLLLLAGSPTLAQDNGLTAQANGLIRQIEAAEVQREALIAELDAVDRRIARLEASEVFFTAGRFMKLQESIQRDIERLKEKRDTLSNQLEETKERISTLQAEMPQDELLAEEFIQQQQSPAQQLWQPEALFRF